MDNLDESILGAEGVVGASENRPGNHNSHCLNCGTKLEDVFCHHCGQKDLPRRQTMGELWENVISSFFSYEGKFLLTVRYLITKPGLLAMEFNSGKRERFFHPVRMYAFISFIFFLVFFSLPEEEKKPKDQIELTEEDKRDLAENQQSIKKGLAAYGVDTTVMKLDTVALNTDSTGIKKKKNKMSFSMTKGDYDRVSQYDSAQALLPDSARDGWFRQRMERRTIELNERFADDKSFGKAFWKASLENFPKVLFFLLPVFALLMKLLYVRRNYFYSEHLVFSIYYYNFFYFAGSLMLLAGLVPALDWLSSLLGWAIYFYLLLAMKRMYGQGWMKTTLKFFIFSFLFLICFTLGFLVNLFVIVMIL